MKLRLFGLALLIVALVYPIVHSMGSRACVDLSGEEFALSTIAMPPKKVTGDRMMDGSVFIWIVDAQDVDHHFAFPDSSEVLLTGRGEFTHTEVYSGTPLVGMRGSNGERLDGKPFVDHALAKRTLIQLLKCYRDPKDQGAANAYYRLLNREPRFYERWMTRT